MHSWLHMDALMIALMVTYGCISWLHMIAYGCISWLHMIAYDISSADHSWLRMNALMIALMMALMATYGYMWMHSWLHMATCGCTHGYMWEVDGRICQHMSTCGCTHVNICYTHDRPHDCILFITFHQWRTFMLNWCAH